jgi:hypothetical protein
MDFTFIFRNSKPILTKGGRQTGEEKSLTFTIQKQENHPFSHTHNYVRTCHIQWHKKRREIHCHLTLTHKQKRAKPKVSLAIPANTTTPQHQNTRALRTPEVRCTEIICKAEQQPLRPWPSVRQRHAC